MPSLISETEKASLTGIFGVIFDTFSRDVYIYKKPQRVNPGGVINTAFIFGYEVGTWDDGYTYIYSSGVYPAVIKYDTKLQDSDYGDVGVRQPVVAGNIKVKTEGVFSPNLDGAFGNVLSSNEVFVVIVVFPPSPLT